MNYRLIPAANVEAFLANAAVGTVIKGVDCGTVYEMAFIDGWYCPGLSGPSKASVLVNDQQDFLVLFDPRNENTSHTA